MSGQRFGQELKAYFGVNLGLRGFTGRLGHNSSIHWHCMLMSSARWIFSVVDFLYLGGQLECLGRDFHVCVTVFGKARESMTSLSLPSRLFYLLERNLDQVYMMNDFLILILRRRRHHLLRRRNHDRDYIHLRRIFGMKS